MDIIAYANTISVTHFIPFFVGWFVRMHYKTTKNAFKSLMKYSKLREFLTKKVGKDGNIATFVHRNIYSQVLSNPFYYMYPDLKMKSHGWDMKKDNGDILDMIGKVYDDLVKEIKAWESGKKDLVRMSIIVGSLSHLIADSYTIGQISSEYWGKVDDRIDVWSDWCAASYDNNHLFPILTKWEILDYVHRGIEHTYMYWHGKADQWKRCIYRRWCWIGPWKVRKYSHMQSLESSKAIAMAIMNAYREAIYSGEDKEKGDKDKNSGFDNDEAKFQNIAKGRKKIKPKESASNARTKKEA